MGVGGLTLEMFYTADGLDSSVFQVPDLSALARDTITSDAVVNHNDVRMPFTSSPLMAASCTSML
eukprot:255244-Amphidinium_carterae.1